MNITLTNQNVEYLRLQGVLIQLWVFGLGLVIGSFKNICICRIPEKISLLWPASKCVNCSKRIAWYDNTIFFSEANAGIVNIRFQRYIQ
ncbi:MAG: hypothetical protein CMI57_00305 [Parcubacteria group bacterium]|nr:hypothetical protein [Parcubacteria group bacterium]